MSDWVGALRARAARARPTWQDAAVASAVGVSQLAAVVPSALEAGVPLDIAVTVGAAIIAGTAVPLAWRRHAPVIVLVLILAADAALSAAYEGSLAEPALLVAYYTLGRHRELRIALPVLAIALLINAVRGQASTMSVGPDPSSRDEFVLDFLSLYLVTFLVGLALRWRAVRAEARIGQVRVRAEEHRREAVVAERARIARELHGVVTTSLEGMAARAVSAHRRFDEDPAEARQALAEVQATGRQTLAAMRRLLGMLRAPDGNGAALTPQPTLEQVGELVAAARGRGLEVSLSVRGVPGDLPGQVGLAAYRLLQESLSRARVPGSVDVVLSYGERDVRVETIVSGDRGDARSDAVIVREWVRLAGGELRVEERAGGRSLSARFPLRGQEALRWPSVS